MPTDPKKIPGSPSADSWVWNIESFEANLPPQTKLEGSTPKQTEMQQAVELGKRTPSIFKVILLASICGILISIAAVVF